ncbi:MULTISPECIES: hypothetical protein [Variovorax]|jgi:hypothetical protein|uniref:hypothetical protein n=1 Tax=Variovorax TaxID=34072 RepID=UPI00086F3161|nr:MULTISPECIES: hypothetical protein [Variovorax]MBN8757279.1 hypothetical protein [Variovorax sp.]ODU18003.1 MAG: hypothetical protein ABS94_06470 [Variovorax sp. SCN 67-85]ODV24537.1 MAG: hypothetical protein ABT25_14335 [Variovorax sp. SCN 67-20]OJZ13523.1 MAG: hypothetical protein BGP22_25650 [Variovorax sp. 67-131]UKI06169.1 hypothetical protein L3V85_25545 [Variovorax paradoxus]
MTPTIRKLESFAAARDFGPLPDAPAHELSEVLHAFGAATAHATGRGPANDRYSHLIECEFSKEMQARFYVRFDLRVFVVLPYVMTGGVKQLAVDHAELAKLCAPIVKVLQDRKFDQISFDDAARSLSDEMFDKGFADGTVLAYFFESL